MQATAKTSSFHTISNLPQVILPLSPPNVKIENKIAYENSWNNFKSFYCGLILIFIFVSLSVLRFNWAQEQGRHTLLHYLSFRDSISLCKDSWEAMRLLFSQQCWCRIEIYFLCTSHFSRIFKTWALLCMMKSLHPVLLPLLTVS